MILIIIGAKNPAQSSFNEQANSSKILRGTLYICVCVLKVLVQRILYLNLYFLVFLTEVSMIQNTLPYYNHNI